MVELDGAGDHGTSGPAGARRGAREQLLPTDPPSRGSSRVPRSSVTTAATSPRARPARSILQCAQRRDRAGRRRPVRPRRTCQTASSSVLTATGHCPNLSAPEETIAAMRGIPGLLSLAHEPNAGRVRLRGDCSTRLRKICTNTPLADICSLARLTASSCKVNATFLEWTGFERAELVGGRRFRDLLTVGGRIYYETHFQPLLRMQGGVEKSPSRSSPARNGGRLPVLVNARASRPCPTVGVITRITVFDATDCRRYERELLAARQRAEDIARAQADLAPRRSATTSERRSAPSPRRSRCSRSPALDAKRRRIPHGVLQSSSAHALELGHQRAGSRRGWMPETSRPSANGR